MTPRDIVAEAMRITASICVYTNDHVTIKELQAKDGEAEA
jgi:ATP-dependent protease HslVU (ClpYQ) peptidase subunit